MLALIFSGLFSLVCVFGAAGSVTVSLWSPTVRLSLFVLAHIALLASMNIASINYFREKKTLEEDFEHSSFLLQFFAYPCLSGLYLGLFGGIIALIMYGVIIPHSVEVIYCGVEYLKNIALIIADCALLMGVDLILGRLLAKLGIESKLGFFTTDRKGGAFGFCRICAMWLDKKYGVSVNVKESDSPAPLRYEIVLKTVDGGDKKAMDKLKSLLTEYKINGHFAGVARWDAGDLGIFFPQLPVLFENLTEKQCKKIGAGLSLLLHENQLDKDLKIEVRKSSKKYPDRITIKIRSFIFWDSILLPRYIEFVKKNIDNEENGDWWISTREKYSSRTYEIVASLCRVTECMFWGSKEYWYSSREILKGDAPRDVELRYETEMAPFLDIIVKEKPNGFSFTYLSQRETSHYPNHFSLQVYPRAMEIMDDVFQREEKRMEEQRKIEEAQRKIEEERKEHDAEVNAAILRRQKLMQKKTGN